MGEAYSRVNYSKLYGINWDILIQLKSLNNGINGVMYHPIKDIIAHRNGSKLLTINKINRYKKSIVAYITHNNKVISWALILKCYGQEVKFICNLLGIERVKSNNELHIFTHKDHRDKRLASRLIKSIKRKYPGRLYCSTYSESTIFVRLNTLHLKDKEKSRRLKKQYRMEYYN
jgi:hypothetical protein